MHHSDTQPQRYGCARRRTSRRRCIALASTAAIPPAVVAPAGAASSERATTVKIQETAKALDGPRGRSGHLVYVGTRDMSDRSTCTGDCARQWPPLVLDPGVQDRPRCRPEANHRLQVTVHGRSHYLYVGTDAWVRPGVRRQRNVLRGDAERTAATGWS